MNEIRKRGFSLQSKPRFWLSKSVQLLIGSSILQPLFLL